MRRLKAVFCRFRLWVLVGAMELIGEVVGGRVEVWVGGVGSFGSLGGVGRL